VTKSFLMIVNDQYVFEKVIGSYLYIGLDFNELKEPARWWPMGKNRAVVIDPRRSFGPVMGTGSSFRVIPEYREVRLREKLGRNLA
jgi:hypothetical protein